MTDKLLPVSHVAKRLNRCQETIRRYIRCGWLDAVRPRGRGRRGNYLISEASVKKFLATSRDISPQADA